MEQATDELIPTRATLLARLKDWQDQTSWQEFFDIYRKLIYGVARKAGLSESEAQEVVQETMISVAKQMPHFNYDQSVGSFKGWLLNTTRWRITDQLRKRGPLMTPFPAHDAAGDTVVEPQPVLSGSALDSLWDAEWKKDLLEAATKKVKRQIDPQRYQIFDFYVNKSWSPEKVAAAFGVNINQVYLAKHRVTEMLAEEVKRLEQQPGLVGGAELSAEKPVNSVQRL